VGFSAAVDHTTTRVVRSTNLYLNDTAWPLSR